MSNTNENSTDFPADWPQVPASWNPTPAEGGGFDVDAVLTAEVPSMDMADGLRYAVEWIGLDPDAETATGWQWFDGNRMHGVNTVPHPDGDTWVWGDGAVVIAAA